MSEFPADETPEGQGNPEQKKIREALGWADTKERRAERVEAFEACLAHPSSEGHARWDGHRLWREFRSASTGATVMMAAAGMACDPSVALPFLLRNGACPHGTDRHGRGALFKASQGSRKFRVAWVEHLLALGVDPLRQDHDGLTCLPGALRCGDVAVLQALVAGGARPSDADRREALKTNNAATLAWFWDRFGGPDTPEAATAAVVDAARNGYWNQVDLVLARGADPNARVEGVPLLVVACKRSRPRMDLIQALVAYGARPEDVDPSGRGALDVLAARNRFNPNRQRLALAGAQRAIARGTQERFQARLADAGETAVARPRM